MAQRFCCCVGDFRLECTGALASEEVRNRGEFKERRVTKGPLHKKGK